MMVFFSLFILEIHLAVLEIEIEQYATKKDLS